MIRGSLYLFLFLLFAAPGTGATGNAQPPKELVDYIREAHKLGLQDQQVKQNAIKVGWKPEVVDGALHAVAATATVPANPSASVGPHRDRGVSDQYQIGAGDVLQITVWKEPDASVASVVVRADGKVALPLLREVAIAGSTPSEAEALITTRLKPFINEPDVSVIVREVHSKHIYLIGAVKKEGSMDLKYPMTILQALSEAGGLTDYAKRKRIYLLRTEGGKQFRFMFNYDVALRGEQMEQNIYVEPNDTIVVPH